MPSRRAVLAAGGALLAGCGARTIGRREPDVECGPATYEWPMAGHGPARTGAVGDRDLPAADADAARFSQTGTSRLGGGSVGAGPAIGGGVAYVAGDVRVEARDVATGERRWTFEDVDDSVGTTPALGCGAVFVSGANETLALDAADGTLLWRADAGAGTAGDGRGSPAIHDDTVYVADGGVTALDAATGEERWTAAGRYATHGLAVGERVYVADATGDRGRLAAISHGGDTWWETDVGPAYTTPVVADGTVYVTSRGADGAPPRLSAVGADDGTVRWRAPIEPGVYAPPAVADGRVFVAAGNGDVALALDAATGEERWRFRTGVGTAAPAVLGERVLVTATNDGVYALDAATGERRWHSGDLGVVDARPIVAGGRLFYVEGTRSEVYVAG